VKDGGPLVGVLREKFMMPDVVPQGKE